MGCDIATTTGRSAFRSGKGNLSARRALLRTWPARARRERRCHDSVRVHLDTLIGTVFRSARRATPARMVLAVPPRVEGGGPYRGAVPALSVVDRPHAKAPTVPQSGHPSQHGLRKSSLEWIVPRAWRLDSNGRASRSVLQQICSKSVKQPVPRPIRRGSKRADKGEHLSRFRPASCRIGQRTRVRTSGAASAPVFARRGALPPHACRVDFQRSERCQ